MVSAWFHALFEGYNGYFNKLPVKTGALLALLAEWFCFALVIWLGMRALGRSRNRWLRMILHLAFIGLLAFPFDFIRLYHFEVADYTILMLLKRPIIAAGLFLAFGFFLWQHDRVFHALSVLVGIMFPLALITFMRIAFLLLGLQHPRLPSTQPTLSPLISTSPGQPRVVWLLFDETDQRLGFENRPAELRLPELDRLKRESLVATNALPPGDETLVSIPGLVSGQTFSAVTVQGVADLNVTSAKNGETSLWSECPSVFASARALGLNVAAVGWYHPYDRLFGVSLSSCVWYPLPFYEPDRAPTLQGTVLRQLDCLTSTIHLRRVYVDLCRAILPEALAVATNGNYGLVFLHLPPPHKPGIYLPAKDKYTAYGMQKTSGYFNNLILADNWLGTLRRAMEATGQWNRTWLILSSDHSWRQSAIYDGRRDLRVPFMVKAPGANQSATYSAPFPTVLTHDLVLAILRGQITNQANAVFWMSHHRVEQPTILSETEDSE